MEKEVAAAWDEEVGRRLDAYDHGELEMIPAEEVMAKMRAKLFK